MFDAVRQVARTLMDAWRVHQALRDLSLLSDYHLADLGLRREDLAELGRSKRHAGKPNLVEEPILLAALTPCG